MARAPLNEDGGQNGVSGIVDWECSRVEIRASHKDLLSVQKIMEIERWLALMDVQDSADSMAVASSSQEPVNVLPFALMVVTTSGWSRNPLVTTVPAPSFLVPLLADPSV